MENQYDVRAQNVTDGVKIEVLGHAFLFTACQMESVFSVIQKNAEKIRFHEATVEYNRVIYQFEPEELSILKKLIITSTLHSYFQENRNLEIHIDSPTILGDLETVRYVLEFAARKYPDLEKIAVQLTAAVLDIDVLRIKDLFNLNKKYYSVYDYKTSDFPPEGLGDIRLRMNKPKPLPESRKTQWRAILEKTELDASYLIFLCEMLSAMTHADQTVFQCSHYEGPDEMGRRDVEYTVTSGSTALFRKWRQQVNENWELVDVDCDYIEFRGLPDQMDILWNGIPGGQFISMEMEIFGLDRQLGKRILSIAQELFSDVRVGYKTHSAIHKNKGE